MIVTDEFIPNHFVPLFDTTLTPCVTVDLTDGSSDKCNVTVSENCNGTMPDSLDIRAPEDSDLMQPDECDGEGRSYS